MRFMMDIKGLIKKLFFKIILKNNKSVILIKEKIYIEMLEKGRGPKNERYEYQSQLIDFGIKKGDKVLDIGSGAYPFPLATHLADLYEGETTHRSESLIKDGRPFFNCSVENLPFNDKEFDFVYCSHLLEHVENPAKACNELMRVGKRGYIETPTKTSDILFNFTALKNHHKWHIEILGDLLLFMEWK